VRRLKTGVFFITFLILAVSVYADGIPDYYSRYNLLYGPPSAYGSGMAGFVNPANLTLLNAPEMDFYWTAKEDDSLFSDHWGLFTGFPHFGIGVQTQKMDTLRVTNYKIGAGFGSKSTAFGIGYGWSGGDKNASGRERIISAGSIIRPCRHFSLGTVGNFSLESSMHEWVFDVGIRPLGTSKLTLFGDMAMQKGVGFGDAPKSAGAAVEVVSGISLIGRYFKDKTFTVGLTINHGFSGMGGQSHFDTKQKYSYTTYHTRAGEYMPSIFPKLFGKKDKFLPLDLKGTIDYQRYVLFDDETIRFMDLLNYIRAATNDPRIGAITLNLSTMRILPEHAWEIREELKNAQQNGKTIIAFIDRADMTTYHLASIADKIVLDPEGGILLGGYALGKTYFKGTLEKLGLGFDEWRFFKYKSAAEVLSRDKMSDADREQYQAYVDDCYESVRADICEERRLTHVQFDKIVDEQVYIMPSEAIEAKLADTLGRWSDMGKLIGDLTGVKMGGISTKELIAAAAKSNIWGEMPKIAVVYGLGECSMDSGIKGRWLEKVFLKIKKDRSIKAVVFRVDSPGGDALPSDLVAEAIKKCAQVKPVIISQGQVAGSGGYWISMYGDTILAGPNTVTGSIGVIGGWMYDKGLSAKLGMTSDFVKRGEHAELGFGITLPFLGFRVPARNLTVDERAKMEELFRKFYDGFVKKVASGRGMDVDKVKQIAEGHFYSGLDGKANGLVDEIGGLTTAIAIAQQKAGFKSDDEYEIIEIPKYKGFIKWPNLSPVSTVVDDPAIRYIKLISENPWKPLPMLIPGTYPTLK
jgi:protease-4